MPANQRGKQHGHLTRRGHVRQGCLLHGIQHQHIGHRADHSHQQSKAPLRQPQRAGRGQVAQHHGGQQAHAHEVAHVVDEDGRHQQHLDGIAIHHRVAGDESPGEQPVGDAFVDALARGRVVRRAQQPRAPGNQKHPAHHAGNAQSTQRRDFLAQQRDGYQRRQQRPRAPRQRVDHREVCLAVAAQQDDVIHHMQHATGHHKAPLHRAPQRHGIAPQPPAQRCPEEHHEHRGEKRKPRVAPRLFGSNVPAGMDEPGEDDEGEGVETHGWKKAQLECKKPQRLWAAARCSVKGPND